MNLQTLQDKDLILTIEKNIRGGVSSIKGDRWVKSDEKKMIFFIDAINLYGHSICQSLPYDEIKFDKIVKVEDLLKTPDNSDIG